MAPSPGLPPYAPPPFVLPIAWRVLLYVCLPVIVTTALVVGGLNACNRVYYRQPLSLERKPMEVDSALSTFPLNIISQKVRFEDNARRMTPSQSSECFRFDLQ